MDYDLVVVGAGMMGSAAAKYATSGDRTLRVCLIGPTEPKAKTDTSIHGAHYDEARVCRTVDKDTIWGELSQRSVHRFRDIEKQGGLSVYHEVGYLVAGTKGGEYINKFKDFAELMKKEHTFLQTSEIVTKRFPYLTFSPDDQAIYTAKDSGYINPRRLVEAQKRIAQTQGCHIIEHIVESVQPMPNGREGHTILTAGGVKVTSEKVLLCTGGFTHCRDLLPGGAEPSMEHHPNTVILVQVDEQELGQFEGMPCMSYKGGRWDRPGLNIVAYILPPVQYPDGKYYLKIGHGNIEPALLHTPEEITRWYWGGKEPQVEEYLLGVTRSLFPGLKMDSYYFDYCVTTNTCTGYPYVDLVTPNLGVAIGGCGQAAKSSDEIGNMAARMMIKGSWDHDLPGQAFRFHRRQPAHGAKL